jgi:16S rRNA (guanine527-N7)-methyltransferase
MEIARIAELLAPYLEGEVLSSAQLAQMTTYLDVLLRWNARMNLTAVRDPEQIVTRHFGESLFAAHHLFPDPAASATLVDIGSGAGFPGLPIAIARPAVMVTLIEAHGKKATFLKEVLRSTGVKNASVAALRAENYGEKADIVTFRAVERFAAILPVSAGLVKPGGRLAGLFGASQIDEANGVIEDQWEKGRGVNFPGSTQRVLWIARQLDAKSPAL